MGMLFCNADKMNDHILCSRQIVSAIAFHDSCIALVISKSRTAFLLWQITLPVGLIMVNTIHKRFLRYCVTIQIRNNESKRDLSSELADIDLFHPI